MNFEPVRSERDVGVESSRFLGFVQAVTGRLRLVMGIPFVAAILALTASLLVPNRYTSVASFAPVGRRSPQLPSALLGAASQLLPGFSGGDPAQTPGYYVQVLQSRELMVAVLERRYQPGSGGDSVSLLDVLEPADREPDAEKRVDVALRKLRDAMSTSADNQTAIIKVGVELRDRQMAAAVANAFVSQLNDFNLRSSREQARQRRVFVEERVHEVADSLRVAEGRLRAFLLSNRSVRDAPDLEFEQARLQRQVQMVQEMYLTLSRTYESQRVEESNDVAAITVIDPAVPPVRRSYPARRAWVLMAFMVGLSGSVALALLLDWLDASRRRDLQEWRQIRESIGSGLRALRISTRSEP